MNANVKRFCKNTGVSAALMGWLEKKQKVILHQKKRQTSPLTFLCTIKAPAVIPVTWTTVA